MSVVASPDETLVRQGYGYVKLHTNTHSGVYDKVKDFHAKDDAGLE